MRKVLVGVVYVLAVLMCIGRVFMKDVQAEGVRVSVTQRNDEGEELVPLREIFSKAGYEVFWDEEARDVRLVKDFKSVVYTIGRDSILVDNVRESIDVKPKIIDDRTYISVEALEKGLGKRVEWDSARGEITFDKDNYMKANWQGILPLEKTYQNKDKEGKVLASINIKVPQIENLTNKESIDKINEYYRDELNRVFDEYKRLMPSDIVGHMGDAVGYDTSYVVTYNACDMLSVVMVHKNKSSIRVKCDVFDTNTGERVKLQDIIKIDESMVDNFKMDAMIGHVGDNESIAVDDIMFYIDEEGLVFVVNKGIDVVKHRINASENKKLFRGNLSNTFNYKEELFAKKLACKCYKQRARFVDKTIIDGHECYVFKRGSNVGDDAVAVSKYHDRVYKLAKRDGAYVVSDDSSTKVDRLRDSEALSIVRRELNNNGYTYELCGNMVSDKDGQMYIIVRVKDLDGQVDKKIAVGSIDRTLYVERSIGEAKLETNTDGTVTAVGYFEVYDAITSEGKWKGRNFGEESKMVIREDGSGTYYVAGDEEVVKDFRLVNEDNKTYIEITNEVGSLSKGTRFLVEVKEVGNDKCLCIHDKNDKCWRLLVEKYSIFEPMNNKI